MKLKLNKKGAGIETSVMFMMIMSLLCMLLITISLTLYSQERLTGKITDKQAEINKIGDLFVAHPNETFEEYTDVYEFETTNMENGNIMLSVYYKESGRNALTVVIEVIDGSNQIVEWTVTETTIAPDPDPEP